MTAVRLRAALCAADALGRQVLRLALAARDISVVAEAASAGELDALCRAECPDIVIVLSDHAEEWALPVGELATRGTDVLVVGADASPVVALDLLAAGAAGFVTYSVSVSGLIEAILDIRAGGCPIDARCAAPLVAEWRAQRQPSGGGGGPVRELSNREVDVLRLLAAGASTKSAAVALGVSAKTIENHKTRIFSKLGVRSQAQAAAAGLARGILGGGGAPADRVARK